MLDELVKTRRDMVAKVRASMFIMDLQNNGLGCDFKNEEFAKTEVGLKLKSYVRTKGFGFVNELSTLPMPKYMEIFSSIFLKLSQNGYSISKKYEKRALEEADAKIEYLRTCKEEEINDGSENPKRWDFPTVTINGKVFSFYSEEQEKSFEQMTGRSYQVDGEAGEELLSLMEEQQNLSKQLTYSRLVYKMDSGIKSMIYHSFEEFIPQKLEAIASRVNQILGANGN